MRRIIETDETSGFEAMLGKSIMLLCGNYHYTGILAGVNEDHLELNEPQLVYDTGEWSAKEWANAQPLKSPWRVMIQSVESWGAGK